MYRKFNVPQAVVGSCCWRFFVHWSVQFFKLIAEYIEFNQVFTFKNAAACSLLLGFRGLYE